MSPSALAANGGTQPHENMQPFICVNFVIALEGIFPSRN
jgi:microcystin-dependent protein